MHQQKQRCQCLAFTSSTIHDVHVENSINQQVAERIAAVRIQLKMTQADLAEEMSVRLGKEIRPLTVTRLEGGKRPIGVDELIAAAAALHIPAADLIGPSDIPTGFLRVGSAGKEATKAADGVKKAIRAWIRSRDHLARVLSATLVEALPVDLRREAAALAATTVEHLVGEAIREASDESDAQSP